MVQEMKENAKYNSIVLDAIKEYNNLPPEDKPASIDSSPHSHIAQKLISSLLPTLKELDKDGKLTKNPENRKQIVTHLTNMLAAFGRKKTIGRDYTIEQKDIDNEIAPTLKVALTPQYDVIFEAFTKFKEEQLKGQNMLSLERKYYLARKMYNTIHEELAGVSKDTIRKVSVDNIYIGIGEYGRAGKGDAYTIEEKDMKNIAKTIDRCLKDPLYDTVTKGILGYSNINQDDRIGVWWGTIYHIADKLYDGLAKHPEITAIKNSEDQAKLVDAIKTAMFVGRKSLVDGAYTISENEIEKQFIPVVAKILAPEYQEAKNTLVFKDMTPAEAYKIITSAIEARDQATATERNKNNEAASTTKTQATQATQAKQRSGR